MSPSPPVRPTVSGAAHRTTPRLIEGAVADQMVRVSATIAAVMAAAFAALYAITGPSAFALPNLVAAGCFLVIASLRGREAVTLVYLTGIIALVLFAWQLVLLGRIDNGIVVWLVAPNVAAMLLGEAKMAAVFACVTVLELGGVLLASATGWLTPTTDLSNPELVMLASVVGVLILSGAFARASHWGRLQLMRELTARNDELSEALERAEDARSEAVAAATAKERFFANITHEIRTPLSGIAGSAALLAEAPLAPAEHELAVALAGSGRQLVVLVNDMLSHARLQAGNATVESSPVEVARLAADLVDLFGPQAAARHLELRIAVDPDLPPWIDTDEVKLRQVVGNLLANALKFTPRGEVTARFAAEPGAGGRPDRLAVTVRDTGVGIAPDLLERIFEPFVQGDASITRAHAGTGLGLAIARQLASLLGGTLTVRSTPGAGSSFTLAIPLRVAEAPGAGRPDPVVKAAGAGTVHPLRVLLAEDNALNRTVGSRMLERLGADVTVAEDGRRAAQLAAEADFDLVLMDLQMPVLDGIGAAHAIRADERSRCRPPVRLVALTGNAPDDYADACAAAGMDAFLVKPVELHELRDILESVRPGGGAAPASTAEGADAAGGAESTAGGVAP